MYGLNESEGILSETHMSMGYHSNDIIFVQHPMVDNGIHGSLVQLHTSQKTYKET